MDVSISIASALHELAIKDKNMSLKQIINHGLSIGKDIMGTMANTLILAYTGGSLSMIIIFIAFQKSIYEIVNLDSVATEIVRDMAGSIALFCAIPLTSISFGSIEMLT